MSEIKHKYLYAVPVEMPRGSHYGSNYWIMPSRKLGRNVTAFSNLEHDYHVQLEMDARVEFYCEQPTRANVILNGCVRETVFDVYVYYKNGQHGLREVKYFDEFVAAERDPSSRIYKQIEGQRAFCKQNGINYQVITDKDIYKGDYTARNMELLAAKARRIVIDKESELSLAEYIRNRGPFTIGMLIARGRISEVDGLNVLANLYYNGLVKFADINNTHLSYKSEVYYEQEI